MKTRAILFSNPMVLAILAGRKTQTRRIISHFDGKTYATDPARVGEWKCREGKWWAYPENHGASALPMVGKASPYGTAGDRMRVKEAAWMWCEKRPNGKTKTGRPKFRYLPMREAQVHYCAEHPAKPQLDVVSPETGNEWGWRKKIGRFLPAWASRMTLDVAAVRIERLQEISDADAKAEGIEWGQWDAKLPIEGFKMYGGAGITNDPRLSYRTLWDSINGANSWARNPWVWVVTFSPCQTEPSLNSGKMT